MTESEQRAAIRPLGIDQAIGEQLPDRREHAAERATDLDAALLALRHERREPGTQFFGVRRDREECVRRRRVAEPPRLALGMHDRRLLALREFPAQLRAQLLKILHATRSLQCACRACCVHRRSSMRNVPDWPELADVIASGDAMLFTGAGFSADARDLDGNPLPDSEQMRCELSKMIFDDDQVDDSSLQDLYDAALMKCPDRLHAYIARRLRIGDAPLPRHFAAWFTAPWKRIYTLNVDDLEVAVARQYRIPKLDVVHLNGVAGAADELTFSTLQYAQRLCGSDRTYEQLVKDFEQAPFVFAGTTLDEVTLWQHLERRRRSNGEATERPASFLVSSALTRARQILLETLGITWVRATIAEIADELWAPALHHRSTCAASART